MSLADEVDAILVDHIYENIVKPFATIANGLMEDSASVVSPGPTGDGTIREGTYAYVKSTSTEDVATVILTSSPGHASIINARTGYFDRGVSAVVSLL